MASRILSASPPAGNAALQVLALLARDLRILSAVRQHRLPQDPGGTTVKVDLSLPSTTSLRRLLAAVVLAIICLSLLGQVSSSSSMRRGNT